MAPDDLARKGNPPSREDIQKLRDAYHREKRARRRAKREWVKVKHRARKAKHRLERAIDRRKKSKDKHSENEILDGIVDFALWGTRNEPSIHYQQSRPFPHSGNLRGLPLYTDCSGFATMACQDAGAQDPNGRGFDGYGYTGTLYAHCPKVSLADVKPGYLLEHGGSPDSHVNVVVESGSNPMVVSHGQENGPRLYPASVEIAYHGGSGFWLKTA